jgi:hypothetical protein
MAGVLSSLIVAARKDLVQRQADGIIADHRFDKACYVTYTANIAT